MTGLDEQRKIGPARRKSESGQASASTSYQNDPGSLSDMLGLQAALQKPGLQWYKEEDASRELGYAELAAELDASIAAEVEATRRWQQQQQQHGQAQLVPAQQSPTVLHGQHTVRLPRAMYREDTGAKEAIPSAAMAGLPWFPAQSIQSIQPAQPTQSIHPADQRFNQNRSAYGGVDTAPAFAVRDARRASAPHSSMPYQFPASTLSTAPPPSVLAQQPTQMQYQSWLQPVRPQSSSSSSSALSSSQANLNHTFSTQSSSPALLSPLHAYGQIQPDETLPSSSSSTSPLLHSGGKSAWVTEEVSPSPQSASSSSLADGTAGPSRDPSSGKTSSTSLTNTFRRRTADLKENAPACDFCRKRKVKCDRVQPTCSFCTKHGVRCTTQDELRKRGPPTKAQRSEMKQAGFTYDRSKRRWRVVQADGSQHYRTHDEQQQSRGSSTSYPDSNAAANPTNPVLLKHASSTF